MKRSLKLRCPACGDTSIVERPFHIRHHCPVCLSLYKREDGFFVGAILANVVITELVILVFCFFSLLVLGAWSFWLGFDYLVESLPKYRGTRISRI